MRSRQGVSIHPTAEVSDAAEIGAGTKIWSHVQVREGAVIGRLRSCAYGFTARRNLAYAYLPVDLKPGATVEVEVFGQMVPAAVTTDAVVKRESVKG